MGQANSIAAAIAKSRVTSKQPYLFGTASPRKHAKQTYDQRRLNPVSADGVREGAINPALTVPPGKVRLEDLTSTDWRRQLADFLRAYGHTRLSDFTKTVSEETLRNRTDIMFSSVTMLIKDKKLQHVRSLAQVKPRLLPTLFEMWTAKGISKRAQMNYYTNMKWFWKICGLEIPAIATYEKEEGEFTITRTSIRDKSWKGNGVSFDEIYQKLLAIDPVGARLAYAMKTWGLRPKEALCLQPHLADGGNKLLLTRGTKTGRHREILFEHFDGETFRKVLDELKNEVPPECHLAWQNRNLKQAKSRLEYLGRLVGLGLNSATGVTWRGLRHDFAIDNLETMGGQIAPVRGGIAINFRALSAARLKITRAMGHNRLEITGAYYGSFLSLERSQLRAFIRSWNKIEPVMGKIGQVLMDAGIGNMYWIGERALGATGENKYEFVLPEGVDDVLGLKIGTLIAEIVLNATDIDCTVLPWDSLPAAKQVLWESEGVPLFEAVSPLQYMQQKLQAKKAARTAPKLPKKDGPASAAPDEATV